MSSISNPQLTRFNYLMRRLEKLTGLSSLLEEFEEKYMAITDYSDNSKSFQKLIRELSGQVNQLERDLNE